MADLKLTPYDSADYLDSDAAVTAYLDAANDEGTGDPVYMAHVQRVADRARAKIAVTAIASKIKPQR